MATWSIAQVQLSGGDLSNNLLQTLAEPSLVFDSILRQGAFDSCQQLTSYKVKWSIAEAGRLEEKVITGHSGQVLTRTMSQQSTPRPMSKVQKMIQEKEGKQRAGSTARLVRLPLHCCRPEQSSEPILRPA